jgi:hypothetical protein
MAEYLPDSPPPTYQRGQNQIDHIIGSIGFLHAITDAGILPPRTGPLSDHSIVYIDFSLAILSGTPTQVLHDPTHPASRNLWSTDVKAAAKYIESVQNGFHEHNILDRIAILTYRSQRTNRCTDDDVRILYQIDSDITNILLAAERQCKTAGGHAWSPLLANAGRTVIAAKWHLSDLLNHRIADNLVNRAEALLAARAQVCDAYALLRQIQHNAQKIRDAFLDDRAAHLADTRHITQAMAVKQLISAERQSSIFKRLGIWMKSSEHVKLDRILTPDDPNDLPNTTWSAVIEQQALFEVLTTAGQEHFGQAAATPFVTGPIAAKFGPFADNEYCTAILDGTFDFTGIDDITEVHDIVHGMRYPDPSNPTPTIDITITTDTFSAAVKHTRERTSSSPSGRHYGHYRALLRDEQLIGAIANVANYCFLWGITLPRWEKVTQPMIPKDPGTPRVTRLRRITLVEADLNVCLSEIFSNRLMNNAEKHGLIHPAQFGSRRGKMAISAVLLKRLSYDIIRQTRMDACIFDNDASACYDRMIPSIAMIKCRRAGLPPTASRLLLNLLQRMHYYIRTAYGISPTAFSNLIDWVLGVMQGSGHAGCLWVLTSSIMLALMDNTTGATFHSPLPSRSTRRTGESFVDDTSLWLLRLGLTLLVAVRLMQLTAQRWERLLYATGGALNLTKCFWYGIEWTFSPAGAPTMLPSTEGHQISLSSGSDFDNPQPIQRISTSIGKRTLGVRLAPDGNDTQEFHHRLTQANQIAQRIKDAPLGREHIGVGFRAIWRMMIQYPLGATCFSSKQCNKIQARYLPTFLTKMGINRSTATAVRHGPPPLRWHGQFQSGDGTGRPAHHPHHCPPPQE